MSTEIHCEVFPIADRVLVKRNKVEAMSEGGIALPDSAKEKPTEGIVVGTGLGKLKDDGTRAAFEVCIGDGVIFTDYAGTELKVNGEDLLVMPEHDILAILRISGKES